MLQAQKGKTLEFKKDLSSPANIMKTLTQPSHTINVVLLPILQAASYVTVYEFGLKLLFEGGLNEFEKWAIEKFNFIYRIFTLTHP